MSAASPERLAAIRESRDRRQGRKRTAKLHITLTEAERAEFRQLCEEHGMLERELLVNAVRAFKNLDQRVALIEARLTILENKEPRT